MAAAPAAAGSGIDDDNGRKRPIADDTNPSPPRRRGPLETERKAEGGPPLRGGDGKGNVRSPPQSRHSLISDVDGDPERARAERGEKALIALEEGRSERKAVAA